jgi:hypothetical protein
METRARAIEPDAARREDATCGFRRFPVNSTRAGEIRRPLAQ